MRLSKMGPPMGIDHGKAKTSFEVVERARDLHDSGIKASVIAKMLNEKYRTVIDWLKYRTRTHC